MDTCLSRKPLALVTLISLATCVMTVQSEAASKKKPQQPTTQASTQPVTAGPMTSLAGESGLPPYLSAPELGMADQDGFHGLLRGTDPDVGAGDFTFDVLFKFPLSLGGRAHEKGFSVGIGKGPAKPGQSRIIDSAYLKVGASSSFECPVSLVAEKINYSLGKISTSPGPHLVRLRRTGKELVAIVCSDYWAGKTPTVAGVIRDLDKSAPFLSGAGAGLFLQGDASWMAVSLTVNGKAVSPGNVAVAGAKEVASAALTNLGEAKQIPDAFASRHDLQVGKEGLDLSAARGIRTRTGDFVNKNFTLDVVYSWPEDGKRDQSKIVVGLGDGGRIEREGGDRVTAARIGSALCLQLHGSDVQMQFDEDSPNRGIRSGQPIEIAKGKQDDNGPHRLHVVKRGDMLTVSFCPDYRGQFSPRESKTIPSVKMAAPFLDARNSYVFIQGDNGTIHQLRLAVEGETVLVADRSLAVPEFAVESTPLRQSLNRDPKNVLGRQYALDPVFSSPKGLIVSPTGELSWTPEHDQIGHQTFKIDVTENGQTTTESASIDVVSTDDARDVGGDLTKLAGLYELKLEPGTHAISPGLGRTSLLLEGNRLLRLGPDGLRVVETRTLPRIYSQIGEREDCFVALSDKDKVVEVLDKTTLKARRSGQVAYHTCNSLCLNPIRPLSYVAAEKGLGGDTSQIVTFDEQTGQIHEAPECQGSFAVIAPDGHFLYAAYRKIFRTGYDIDQTTWDLRPTYGDVCKLLIFDISTGQPRPDAEINGVGGNGQGIALSPDGKRLSYLSYVGFPLFTNNIPAWDTADLRKAPTSYPCKAHHADCKHVAYHPTLPIAASPASEGGGVACFDRETGDFEPARLVAPLPLPPDTQVLQVFFSPDGRSVILDCDSKGDQFLRKVKLNLSDPELAAAKRSVPIRPLNPNPPKARTSTPQAMATPGNKPALF